MRRFGASFGGRIVGLSLVTGIVALVAPTGGMKVNARQDTIMTRLFAPVEIGADVSDLPASERLALAHIVDAARVMDGLFLQQVWAGNPSMLLSLLGDRSVTGEARLDFFVLNKGPWSRIENNRSFVPEAPDKPNPNDAESSSKPSTIKTTQTCKIYVHVLVQGGRETKQYGLS